MQNPLALAGREQGEGVSARGWQVPAFRRLACASCTPTPQSPPRKGEGRFRSFPNRSSDFAFGLSLASMNLPN